MRKRTVKTRAIQEGAAAVELAVMLIPLVLIAFGITEFGRAFYEYNALAKGTRDGVRFLTMKGPLNPADPTSAADITETKCMVVYGNPGCAGAARVPYLTPAMVSICDSWTCAATHSAQPTGSGVVNLVTVTVTGYTFTPMVPFIMPNPLTFNDIGTTMRQVL
jgi:Flp pilus assembly protein TadG